MKTLNPSNLSLDDVHRLLNLEEHYDGSFTPLLSLEPLKDVEKQELVQIKNDFRPYLRSGKVSEGQVKLVVIAPLLRLAGFYHYPITISVEEGIAEIDSEEEETRITGRLDILAINNQQPTSANNYFWVLVIETKNSLVDVTAGLPQLLTYAYKSLEHQKSVWGLVTNGLRYQFVYLQQETSPIYQLMPLLNLMESDSSIQLLKVLKAICKL
ncbi:MULTISPECIES: restriction endonuclease subunit R [unclassified Moorena]|uniref:restriction endonuclease subunit R n=1 Tax=unclassified Moorena TaxID=2683338 RepID=UPI0013BB3DB3|nr:MULTISPECIES: restriction endonuclease subunit R [unclassified Moorena]NEQ07517.1 restriction endonuclease subunit R [Moorena sp. SIO4E2]NEQ14298.1 restriction endonuclease subunit R [Moorena sp. SIO3E2]NES42532.1 restriction endonuclease subunit R [Moorena sp. SIO2C4]NET69283.1 restriction endonuclease subunit R [Moorena sp. SIO1G6]